MNENRISLKQFSCGDALTDLRHAAEYCSAHPGTILEIPAGKYFLRDPKAVELQRQVMSGYYGNKVEENLFRKDFPYVSGILFQNCRDTVVESAGAELIFGGFLEPLTIENCRNFTMRGIRIDYERRPYSCGTVISAEPESITVDFGDLSMLRETMPVLRILLRRKGKITGIVPDLRRAGVLPEILPGGRVVFHNLKLSHLAQKGDEFNLWHTFHFRPAIHLHDSEEITLQDISVLAQPGMGILGHRSKNILLERIHVIPAPGCGISTNTDATHFASCGGFLTIQDSEFSGHGDDAVNVHTYYHRILEADGRKCSCIMDLRFGTHSQLSDHPDAGDILELTDPETALPLETFTVQEKKETGHCRTELLLDHPLPSGAAGKLLIDISQVPRFTFRNCSVSDHIARGVLIKTRHAVVEGNRIEGSSGTGIQIAAESFWLEGPVSQDVTIRNNKILSCGGGPGTIRNTGGIVIEGGMGHRDIRMENNVILCPEMEHAVSLSGAGNVVLCGNVLESAGEKVFAENCGEIQRKDN